MRFPANASFLVVVAHPDDEVLGFGASAFRLTSSGHTVHSAILAGDADARTRRPSLSDLHADTDEAHKALGLEPPMRGGFPNIKLNSVPHLDLVQFIEGAIRAASPDVVVTLHPGDINDDHHQVSVACQAAARLPQRDPTQKTIRALLFMEVLSSTEWAINPRGGAFSPNIFHPVGADAVTAKIEALAKYRDVMRPYPHPRSTEAIQALATLRGAQAGMDRAEAFEAGLIHLD